MNRYICFTASLLTFKFIKSTLIPLGLSLFFVFTQRAMGRTDWLTSSRRTLTRRILTQLLLLTLAAIYVSAVIGPPWTWPTNTHHVTALSAPPAVPATAEATEREHRSWWERARESVAARARRLARATDRAAEDTRHAASDAYSHSRNLAAEAAARARHFGSDAVAHTRDTAIDAADRTREVGANAYTRARNSIFGAESRASDAARNAAADTRDFVRRADDRIEAGVTSAAADTRGIGRRVF